MSRSAAFSGCLNSALSSRVTFASSALTSRPPPLPAAPSDVLVKRVKNAYPIYGRGYERDLDVVDAWLSEVEGLTFFGRQGLFAHDNTHHALRRCP